MSFGADPGIPFGFAIGGFRYPGGVAFGGPHSYKVDGVEILEGTWKEPRGCAFLSRDYLEVSENSGVAVAAVELREALAIRAIGKCTSALKAELVGAATAKLGRRIRRARLFR